jgi:AbrB family looped-hinge helix DNA binding protein
MNKKETRMRTVSVNERGQIVIPEEIRDNMGIRANSILVLIEKDGELTIKKESDVIAAIDEDLLWRRLSRESLPRMWEKEDAVWDKIARKDLV